MNNWQKLCKAMGRKFSTRNDLVDYLTGVILPVFFEWSDLDISEHVPAKIGEEVEHIDAILSQNGQPVVIWHIAAPGSKNETEFLGQLESRMKSLNAEFGVLLSESALELARYFDDKFENFLRLEFNNVDSKDGEQFCNLMLSKNYSTEGARQFFQIFRPDILETERVSDIEGALISDDSRELIISSLLKTKTFDCSENILRKAFSSVRIIRTADIPEVHVAHKTVNAPLGGKTTLNILVDQVVDGELADKTPCRAIIDGSEFAAASWKEVAVLSFSYIAQKYPQKMQNFLLNPEILNNYRHPAVSTLKDYLRQSVVIPNTRFFLEGVASDEMFYNWVKKALQHIQKTSSTSIIITVDIV